MGAPGGGGEAIISAIRAFRHSLGISGTVADAGCGESDIPPLAARAIADPCLATNPKEMTLEDIGIIYEAAL
jgi:alcohol dehydrogenase class IV